MAERKFDYENISTIYNEMKKITGSAGDTDSIAGILDKIDKDVHESVGVEDEAIFGDLGSQLLLDWENSSSNFGGFVDNFNNWSTLIAQSAGKYSEFENKVKGLKTDNPLGMTSKGMTSNYIDSSYYKEYTTENFNALANQIGDFKEYNGYSYIDTNMVAREQERLTGAKVSFTLNAVSTILSIFGGKKIVGAERAAGKTILGIATRSAAPALPGGVATQPTLSGGTNNQLALPSGTGASASNGTASAWAAYNPETGAIVYGPGVNPSSITNAGVAATEVVESSGTAVANAVLDANGNVITYLGNPAQRFAASVNAGFHNIAPVVQNGAQNVGRFIVKNPSSVAAITGANIINSFDANNKVTVNGVTYVASPFLNSNLTDDDQNDSINNNIYIEE